MPGRDIGDVLLLVGVKLGEYRGENSGIVGQEGKVGIAGELSTVEGLRQDGYERLKVWFLC